MAERDAGEPVDADVNVVGRFLAARNIEFAAARRAGTYEDRVVFLREQLLQAVDARSALELDAEVQDVIGFLVDHQIRQPEFRNLRPHHAAGLGVGIEHGAMIAERRKVARDRERGGTAADERDALAVLRHRPRQAMLDVVLEVGGDALQAADRDRTVLDAAAAACRLARPIAGASQNSGKHVRSPIDHVGVAVAPLRNQPDVFRNWRMRGTSPLAVDHFVKVVGCRDISRFHSCLSAQQHRTRGPLSYLRRLSEPSSGFWVGSQGCLHRTIRDDAQRQICLFTRFHRCNVNMIVHAMRHCNMM